MLITQLPFDPGDATIRLGLSVVLAGVIGLNRDIHGKPAGLRTHALVGLGAAMLTLTSIYLVGGDGGAVTRTIQGIVTGVGFVGAGVIIHRTDPVGIHGLTTAASIWVVSALGVACGGGQIGMALIAFSLMLLVLVFGGVVERRVHRWLVRETRVQPTAPSAAKAKE